MATDTDRVTFGVGWGLRLSASREVELSVLAEELGLDGVWPGEHPTARFAGYEPHIVLTYIAAKTERIKLGTAAYLTIRSQGSGQLPDVFTIQGVCLACQKEGEAKFEAEENPPLVCPLCGERAVFEWMFCQTCKKRFVPILETDPDGGPPHLPVVPVCLACGSNRTGSYIPQRPGYESEGDVLPKWPP